MPMGRLRRARYTLDPRLKKDERQKLKTGKNMGIDLKMVGRLWEDLEPEKKIVKISKEMGLSKAYTKILIKRIRKMKAYR
jgi:hypothetical protein